MGEEGGVRQVEKAGGVVGHTIGRAGNVVVEAHVTVETLVQAVHAEQVCGCAVGGDRAFATSGDGRKVIVDQGDGVLANVGQGGQDILVSQDASQLQVAVGDRAGGVGGRDHVGLNVRREPVAPNSTSAIRKEPDAAHAQLRRIAGAQESGDVRDNFSEPSGTVGDGSREFFEVRQLGADGGGDANAVSVTITKTGL
jgi:hypothetical protein